MNCLIYMLDNAGINASKIHGALCSVVMAETGIGDGGLRTSAVSAPQFQQQDLEVFPPFVGGNELDVSGISFSRVIERII
jgi:hypothetical protein